MRCSWFSSLLLILVTAGCVSVKPARIREDRYQPDVAFGKRVQYRPPRGSHLFKASIDIKKHHLTGLLLIKAMPNVNPGAGVQDPVYRIVFANEIGLTFFDLELSGNRMKVISCFESLKKKALLSILETDLRQLTDIERFTAKTRFRQQDTENRIILGKTGSFVCWQSWSPAGDTLYSISGKSTVADPAIISFKDYASGLPTRITIDNPVIGMKLSLRMLKME